MPHALYCVPKRAVDFNRDIEIFGKSDNFRSENHRRPQREALGMAMNFFLNIVEYIFNILISKGLICCSFKSKGVVPSAPASFELSPD